MKTIIKDALILFAITAIAGLMLALVNEVTKDPIAEQQLKAKSDACKVVFEDASSFARPPVRRSKPSSTPFFMPKRMGFVE